MTTQPRRNLVLTIGRLKGSGGVQIGKQLATRLGCTYLDKEILIAAAGRLRADPDYLQALDDKKLNFWERARMEIRHGIPSEFYVPPPLNLQDSGLYEAENAIIIEAASNGPVVVVGRAGFRILKDEPRLLSVFLHAPFEQRVERVRNIYRLSSRDEAERVVRQSDRQREGFMKSVLGNEWLDPRNFQLCLDTGKLGIPVVTELVATAAVRMLTEERESLAS